MHDLRLIHTDLKPENILLVSSKYVKVHDYKIVVTIAEHHSAIVPWQLIFEKTGAVLKFVSLTEDEVPDLKMLQDSHSNKAKIVVVHHVSNVLASVLPIKDIA